ncbi:hypothetical protein V6Z11_D06G246400 [Gossypium hirsutum]
MSSSTSAAVPRAGNDDEIRAASIMEREINSSDMEIDDDDENEEDLQSSSNRNDAGNVVESRGHDGQLGSDLSSTPGNCEPRIPAKTLNVGEGSANFEFSSLPNESLATQKEGLCTNYVASKYSVSGKEPAKENGIQEYMGNGKDSRNMLERKASQDYPDQHTNGKGHFVVDESNSLPVGYHSGGVNNGLGFEEKNKQMDVQTDDDKRKIKSRSAAPQTSAGSLSPSSNSENKRPALICDFFARGWCIKGSSCRFLHIKDGGKNPGQLPQEDTAAADGKRAVELDEGFRSAAERSRSPASADALPSSVVNKTGLSSHFFSERILPLGHDENQRLHLFHEMNKFPLLQSKDPPTYGNFASRRPLLPERNDDKRTASCHNGVHENLVSSNCNPSGKDSLTTDANDGTSAVDMQNGTLVKEEISSVASHVKDISKANKNDRDHDGRHRRGGSRCKKDLEVDRVREKNEIDVEVEHKADGDYKESKAMRRFHAALVDLIKQLLKPTWREGHLSKDAHNTIVKKAVDKVFGSIQPHQLPVTFESVKQYLSSSQPKITRLVEGYIEKYKKS